MSGQEAWRLCRAPTLRLPSRKQHSYARLSRAVVIFDDFTGLDKTVAQVEMLRRIFRMRVQVDNLHPCKFP